MCVFLELSRRANITQFSRAPITKVHIYTLADRDGRIVTRLIVAGVVHLCMHAVSMGSSSTSVVEDQKLDFHLHWYLGVRMKVTGSVCTRCGQNERKPND